MNQLGGQTYHEPIAVTRSGLILQLERTDGALLRPYDLRMEVGGQGGPQRHLNTVPRKRTGKVCGPDHNAFLQAQEGSLIRLYHPVPLLTDPPCHCHPQGRVSILNFASQPMGLSKTPRGPCTQAGSSQHPSFSSLLAWPTILRHPPTSTTASFHQTSLVKPLSQLSENVPFVK